MSLRPKQYDKRIANVASAFGVSRQAVYAALKTHGEKNIARRLRELAKLKPADADALHELASKFISGGGQ